MNNVLDTLASLFAKANDKSASEAEAEAAMKMASRIMKKNLLSEADVMKRLGQLNNIYVKNVVRFPGKQLPDYARFGLVLSLAKFVGIEVYASQDEQGRFMVLFGEQPNIDMFKYVLAIVTNSAEHEYNKYRARSKSNLHGRTLRQSFMVGFYPRMSQRLAEIKKSMEEEVKVAETGTAIILVKSRELADNFRKHRQEEGLRLQQKTTRTVSRSKEAIDAGVRGANNVNIHKAIG